MTRRHDDEEPGLDLLFSAEPEEDEPRPEGGPRPGAMGWWIANAAVIALLTAAAVGGMRMVGVRLPIALVATGFIALRALWLIVAGVAPPPPPRAPARRVSYTDNAGRSEFTSGDALRSAVRRWENRLQGPAEPARFSRNVLPVLAELAELADERLRQRHGLTRATDPEQARALLGEPLWRLLEDPARKPPKAKEWAAHVQALEKL